VRRMKRPGAKLAHTIMSPRFGGKKRVGRKVYA
jgi:hypothetical protein